MPFGFVVYSPEKELYFLQTETMHSTSLCEDTIADLLKDIQMNVAGDISLEYFQTIDE